MLLVVTNQLGRSFKNSLRMHVQFLPDRHVLMHLIPLPQ